MVLSAISGMQAGINIPLGGETGDPVGQFFLRVDKFKSAIGDRLHGRVMLKPSQAR